MADEARPRGALARRLRLPRADSPTYILVSRVATAALALLSAPIIARALGPDGRGELATIAALYAVVPILVAAGLPLAVRRRAAIEEPGAVLRPARVLTLLATVPAVIVAAVMYFTVIASVDTPARLVAALGIALAPLAVSWASDMSVLVARHRFSAVFALQLVQPVIVMTVAIVTFATGTATLPWLLAAYIVGNAATFVLGLVLTARYKSASRDSIRGVLSESVTYFGGALAEAATFRLDQILALPVLGAFQAGLYSVAVTIGMAPLAIGHAVAAAHYASMARAGEHHGAEAAGRAVRSAIALAIVTVIAMLLVVPFAVPLLFGADFAGAVGPTMISSVGVGSMIVMYVGTQALAARRRGGRMTAISVVTALLGVALLLAFATLGATGAALASTLAYTAGAIGVLVANRLPWREVLPRPSDLTRAIRELLRGVEHDRRTHPPVAD